MNVTREYLKQNLKRLWKEVHLGVSLEASEKLWNKLRELNEALDKITNDLAAKGGK